MFFLSFLSSADIPHASQSPIPDHQSPITTPQIQITKSTKPWNHEIIKTYASPSHTCPTKPNPQTQSSNPNSKSEFKFKSKPKKKVSTVIKIKINIKIIIIIIITATTWHDARVPYLPPSPTSLPLTSFPNRKSHKNKKVSYPPSKRLIKPGGKKKKKIKHIQCEILYILPSKRWFVPISQQKAFER